MEPCFYHPTCRGHTVHVLRCPSPGCPGRGGEGTRLPQAFLCAGCLARGCPHCGRSAQDLDIHSDIFSADATTESGLVALVRPVADDAATSVVPGWVPIPDASSNAEPPANDVLLVSLRHDSVDYRWNRQGELHNLKIRPKAAALVAFLLGQQDLGRCQLGFYTTLSGENAGLVAKRQLRGCLVLF